MTATQAISEIERNWRSEDDGIMPRDQMVLRIMRHRDSADEAAARVIEGRWHDAAWSASLQTDDAGRDQCDHNDRTYRRVYQSYVDEYFRAVS